MAVPGLFELRIRPVREVDLDRVLEIECASFDQPWSFASFNRIFRRSPEDFLIAEIDGEVIGYAVMGEGATHLMDLAVEKRYRCLGIGEALIKAGLERARIKGAPYVKLEVRVSNTIARNLYHKLGFRERGIIPDYYLDGESALLLLKDLSGGHPSRIWGRF